jgi:hypothetical protein
MTKENFAGWPRSNGHSIPRLQTCWRALKRAFVTEVHLL